MNVHIGILVSLNTNDPNSGGEVQIVAMGETMREVDVCIRRELLLPDPLNPQYGKYSAFSPQTLTCDMLDGTEHGTDELQARLCAEWTEVLNRSLDEYLELINSEFHPPIAELLRAKFFRAGAVDMRRHAF